MSAALLVFAKAPVPGQVKTRLVPVLGSAGAAALYAAFLRDALAQYAALGVAVRLYLAPSLTEGAPAGAAAPPEGFLPEGFLTEGIVVRRQQGSGLGARMQHAFADAFAAGHGRAVVIGTDHPTLPSPFVGEAFRALEEPLSVVLGPSLDGGFYLLGMNDLFPQLFAGMRYSHPGVLAHTLERAAALRAGVTLLPPWYDVDTPDDLAHLARDLVADAAAAPHTACFLREAGLLH